MKLPVIDIGTQRGEWMKKQKHEDKESFAATIRRLIDQQMSTDSKLEARKLAHQEKMMKQHRSDRNAPS